MARVSEEQPPSSPAIGRIPILDVQPVVDAGRWAAKAYDGEVLPFSATVFREGHDAVGAHLELESPRGALTDVRLRRVHSWDDRYRALAQVTSEGQWRFRIRAFSDDFATWEHNASIKIANGVDVELMFTIGVQLFKRLSKEKGRSAASKALFKQVAATLADTRLPVAERLAPVSSEAVESALAAKPAQSLVTYSDWHPLTVERSRAGVGSWYEFFPRSIGAEQAADGTWTSGTLASAAERLPAVAEMGFDVVYLPPVHPIGSAFRKGRNNTLDPQPGDPGSPWAIGAESGGHDTIHPDLGTTADFASFVGAASRLGLEVAMDFALQASPDHPWVKEHPEWFTTLPDGSIAYAENPPKKYQDIYPINFDNDPAGIRQETLRILLHWIALGVKIFRVDNPHTKPVDFWEWVIAEVTARHPDVVFLAEAFTRPAMMQTLGKVGFQQSYSYFTWRNTKEELTEFFEMLGEWAPYYRANLFVNTPDILTEYLQFGGRPAFEIRAIIAATASPSWGVYSGYELVENVARPGAEENIDNEKYEYRPRDFAAAEAAGASLAPLLTRLNGIRRDHASLRQVREIDVHWSDDDAVLVYSKHLDERFARGAAADTIIVVVNTDPHSVRETTVHLDPTRFGFEADSEFAVTDLLTGQEYVWGQHDYVRLDAFTQPAHILHVHHERGDD